MSAATNAPRQVLRSAVLLGTMSVLLLGCPLLKKKTTDDTPSAEDAATVSVTGTGAKNEADVLRYDKEEKIADEPATVSKDGTDAKTFPGNGQHVAFLAKNTSVVKKAKYFSTGVLVLFDDPKGTGDKLLGWVPPEALAVSTTAPTTTATATNKPVVVTVVDAGAAPKDAGAPAKDAGAPVAVVDAGAAPAPKKTDITAPLSADGKCPAGFTKTVINCSRVCSTDNDCPHNTFCVSKYGAKICSTSK